MWYSDAWLLKIVKFSLSGISGHSEQSWILIGTKRLSITSAVLILFTLIWKALCHEQGLHLHIFFVCLGPAWACVLARLHALTSLAWDFLWRFHRGRWWDWWRFFGFLSLLVSGNWCAWWLEYYNGCDWCWWGCWWLDGFKQWLDFNYIFLETEEKKLINLKNTLGKQRVSSSESLHPSPSASTSIIRIITNKAFYILYRILWHLIALP